MVFAEFSPKSPQNSQRSIAIIDFSWSLYRGYYAFRQLEVMFNGFKKPTGHIFGVLNDVENALRLGNAQVFLALDGRAKGKSIDKNYKDNRQRLDYNIHQDIPAILSMAYLHPAVSSIHHPSLEADEVIYSYAKQSERAGHRVEIWSTDDDMLQCLSSVVSIRKGSRPEDLITLDAYLTSEKYLAKYANCPPHLLPIFRAFTGDKSDNLSGVPGIRKQRLARLVPVLSTESKEAFLLSFQEAGQLDINLCVQCFPYLDKIWSNFTIMRLQEYPLTSVNLRTSDCPDGSAGKSFIASLKMGKWSRFLDNL